MRRRTLAAGVLFLVASGVLGACGGSNNFRDLESVNSEDPDLARVFNNMDAHPNIGMLCIEGVAFATTTREYTSVLRVPEWDAQCP